MLNFLRNFTADMILLIGIIILGTLAVPMLILWYITDSGGFWFLVLAVIGLLILRKVNRLENNAR